MITTAPLNPAETGDLKSVTVYQKTDPANTSSSTKPFTSMTPMVPTKETLKAVAPANPARDIVTKYYDDQHRLVRTEDPLYDPANPTRHQTSTAYNDYGKPVSTTSAPRASHLLPL